MASGNAKSEESEFEPDNNFFDNFLDGMDVLIDKCRDSEEDRWIAGRTDEGSDTSSGGDRMVIDLPSSAESGKSEKVKKNETSDITDILTNRVLAHLEKSSSNGKNKTENSFPSNRLVIDVLDRLKKSVQQKNEPPSRTASHPETSGSRIGSRECAKALSFNFHKDILSNEPAESDDEKRRPDNRTKFLHWIFSEENTGMGKSQFEEPHASSSHGLGVYDVFSDLDRHKKKRKRHRKHKSSKTNDEDFGRHGRSHRKKSKKRVRKESSEEEKRAVNSDPSLESVSSENEDDILNKHTDEEESEKEPYMANSAQCKKSVKQQDCEEGEVLSSSSDWESECLKRRRTALLPPRQKYFSPSSSDGAWPRRCEARRTPSPPWLRQRLKPEEHGRFVVRRIRSPVHYVRMSQWTEQQGDSPRGRIPIPRPRSLSPPLPIHLHTRSTNRERISSQLSPPFIDNLEIFTPRRTEHPPLYRPRSPRKEVHESHRVKSYAPMEIHPREAIPCHKLRTERRFPPESGNERREKSSLLRRCLKEIKHRSYKPGRFKYDSKDPVPVPKIDCPKSRYSSPLHSSKLQAPRLKFTTPTTRDIGTSSSSLQSITSVGCQTEEYKFQNFSEDQVRKRHSLQPQCTKLSRVAKATPQTVINADFSNTSSKTREATSQQCRVSVESGVEKQDITEGTTSRVLESKNFNDSSSTQRTLEMWKSIVSFRYPDLSEKEREQVVLIKSMETGKTESTQ